MEGGTSRRMAMVSWETMLILRGKGGDYAVMWNMTFEKIGWYCSGGGSGSGSAAAAAAAAARARRWVDDGFGFDSEHL
jgi:hypothetical protein